MHTDLEYTDLLMSYEEQWSKKDQDTLYRVERGDRPMIYKGAEVWARMNIQKCNKY